MVRDVRSNELEAYNAREQGQGFHILDLMYDKGYASEPYHGIDHAPVQWYNLDATILRYVTKNTSLPETISFGSRSWARTRWGTPLFSAIALFVDADFCPGCMIQLHPTDGVMQFQGSQLWNIMQGAEGWISDPERDMPSIHLLRYEAHVQFSGGFVWRRIGQSRLAFKFTLAARDLSKTDKVSLYLRLPTAEWACVEMSIGRSDPMQRWGFRCIVRETENPTAGMPMWRRW